MGFTTLLSYHFPTGEQGVSAFTEYMTDETELDRCLDDDYVLRYPVLCIRLGERAQAGPRQKNRLNR